uniref:Uncharacterized protein n=1 Tax=Oryza sativa subsp. japonica TaxID=39947 RepID=Q5W658_ORYSJ|nr:hypothetical protein [Oryza sativa Japonica Group]AAV44099.1 hypothetical protein [Oryza sativa Japonica Group]
MVNGDGSQFEPKTRSDLEKPLTEEKAWDQHPSGGSGTGPVSNASTSATSTCWHSDNCQHLSKTMTKLMGKWPGCN